MRPKVVFNLLAGSSRTYGCLLWVGFRFPKDRTSKTLPTKDVQQLDATFRIRLNNSPLSSYYYVIQGDTGCLIAESGYCSSR